MKAFHMVEEHNKAPNLDRITIRLMLSMSSNNNNNNDDINMHEKRFSKLENFQANTIVFQANTNGSLKNSEMQIGQLALNLQNWSKDFFSK